MAKPPYVKMPYSLTAVELEAQMIRDGEISPREPKPPRPMSPEDERFLLEGHRRSASAGALIRAVTDGPLSKGPVAPDEQYDGHQMVLLPSSVKTYDRNPRRTRNPKREEIKESIKAVGVLNPLTITRRPGDTEYMVYGGGNTRLEICQELASEFPDNLLYTELHVTYRAWRGESAVMAAHVAENESRADTTFWDKVNALVELKKALELEAGASMTSNEVRLKAASVGWKVSRDTVLLYDFAAKWLAPVGPQLTYTSARLLKDRFDQLALLMSRLDARGGQKAFEVMFAEEMAIQEKRLTGSNEPQDFNSPLTEVDANAICSALDERVAQTINGSFTEVRQMLAVLMGSPSATADDLRAEVAAGGSVARQPEPQAEPAGMRGAGHDGPAAAHAPAQQAVLPMAMLAVVPPAQSPLPATGGGTDDSSVRTHLPPQVDQPPELAASADAAIRTTAPAEAPVEVRQAAARALLEAMNVLAHNTLTTEFFRVCNQMPLGFLMEPPHGPFQALPDVDMPPDQQIHLRRAGWQLLATLSAQFDYRTCNEDFMPKDSRWLQLVLSGDLRETLAACGIGVSAEGALQLDADCVFYVLTEPKLLSPAVAELLRALAVRRDTLASVLPHRLAMVTSGQTPTA